MERMDRYRLVGGWAWVVSGVLVQVVALGTGRASPGPVTWLLTADVVALAVLLVRRRDGRAARVLGWLTAVLFAADLGGAVLDRFGVLGGPGAAGVSWGSWTAFTGYTAVLLHHPGGSLVTAAAVAATVTEVALAGLLLSGWQRRWVGKATAGLFVVYLLAMAASAARVDVAGYAVPVLVGGALLLSATPARRPPQGPRPGTTGRRPGRAGRADVTDGQPAFR